MVRTLIGFALILCAFGIIISRIVAVHGWSTCLGIWGAAIRITAMIVLGIFLIIR